MPARRLFLSIFCLFLAACESGEEGKDFTVKGFWTFEQTVVDAECAEYQARKGETTVAYRKLDQREGVTRMHILSFLGVNGIQPTEKWGSIEEFQLEGQTLTGPINVAGIEVADRVKLEVENSNRLISSKNYRREVDGCNVSYSVVMRKISDTAENQYAKQRASAEPISLESGYSSQTVSLNSEGYYIYQFPLATEDEIGVVVSQGLDKFALGVLDADGRIIASYRDRKSTRSDICEQYTPAIDEEIDLCFDQRVLPGGTGQHYLLIEDLQPGEHDGVLTVEVFYREAD
ncbi:hypothetical protein GP5015_2050 [gamma proteobacterium HTCC5015]|nr:hypothetical protein GP5015_2050 [gamma proteobacterium HTCC5015]